MPCDRYKKLSKFFNYAAILGFSAPQVLKILKLLLMLTIIK
ncbi:hypothetical protein APA_2338 [Pseudanabaena sp. lw0831]|nr:hypothetical protein APA_2338 [Pseudanabaena sp. lw0831]